MTDRRPTDYTPPERAPGEPEAAHVHRTTLWALAHPEAGLYLCADELLERVLQHTIGVVQGKTPGLDFADRVANLRRAAYLALRLRAAERKTAEARQAAAFRRLVEPLTEGGQRTPRHDVPPPKAPPARVPEPEGAL